MGNTALGDPWTSEPGQTSDPNDAPVIGDPNEPWDINVGSSSLTNSDPNSNVQTLTGNTGSGDSALDTYGSEGVPEKVTAEDYSPWITQNKTHTGQDTTPKEAMETYGSANVTGRDQSTSAIDASVGKYGEQGEDQTKASSEYVRDESTVAGQMDKLLQSDDPWMKQAEARGRAQAQATGQASAGGGVGAVEAQRIAAAMQIAKPDAATQASHDAMEHKQDIEQDAAAKGQEYKVRSAEQIAGIEEGLKGYEHDLSNLDKEQQYDIFERMSTFNHDLQTRGKLVDAELNKSLSAYQHDLNVRLQKMGFDSKEKQVAMGLIGGMTNNLMNMISTLNTNTDIPEADKKTIQEMYVKQYQESANLFTSFIGQQVYF